VGLPAHGARRSTRRRRRTGRAARARPGSGRGEEGARDRRGRGEAAPPAALPSRTKDHRAKGGDRGGGNGEGAGPVTRQDRGLTGRKGGVALPESTESNGRLRRNAVR